MKRKRMARAGEVAGQQRLYDGERHQPAIGYCTVCDRRRPIGPGTFSNFGCLEDEADDEDREFWKCAGTHRLGCGQCAATCVPIFLRGEQPAQAKEGEVRREG